MAIPSGAVHYVMSGNMSGGETWNSGFWTASNGSLSLAALTAKAALVDTRWRTCFTTLKPFMGAQTSYFQLKAYYYTGAATATQVATVSGTAIVGNSVTPMPNQVALVATTETGLSGRKFRGRIFLPLNGLALASPSNQITSANCTTIANAVGTFLTGVNTDTAPGVAVVLSQVTGNVQAITSVLVDSRPDVQRRRANKQLATTFSTQGV